MSWNDGVPVPIPVPFVSGMPGVFEWHSRQRNLTTLRVSNFGLVEPCGVWQAWQPSILTGACSYTKGPCLSAWHLTHAESPLAELRSDLLMNPPCWLWQSEHFMPPSGTLWWKGLANVAFWSAWHV